MTYLSIVILSQTLTHPKLTLVGYSMMFRHSGAPALVNQFQTNKFPLNFLLMKLVSKVGALFCIQQKKKIPRKKKPVCQVFRITNIQAFMNQSVIIK